MILDTVSSVFYFVLFFWVGSKGRGSWERLSIYLMMDRAGDFFRTLSTYTL